jgi:hypothetical protein
MAKEMIIIYNEYTILIIVYSTPHNHHVLFCKIFNIFHS